MVMSPALQLTRLIRLTTKPIKVQPFVFFKQVLMELNVKALKSICWDVVIGAAGQGDGTVRVAASRGQIPIRHGAVGRDGVIRVEPFLVQPSN